MVGESKFVLFCPSCHEYSYLIRSLSRHRRGWVFLIGLATDELRRGKYSKCCSLKHIIHYWRWMVLWLAAADIAFMYLVHCCCTCIVSCVELIWIVLNVKVLAASSSQDPSLHHQDCSVAS